MWRSILPEVNDAQHYLQTEGLDIQQCHMKLSALRGFLLDNRDQLVENSLNYAKQLCDDLGIPIERRVRRKKRMVDELAEDEPLSYEADMKREMYSCIDSARKEIEERFEQLHCLSQKYAFLLPANLLNENYNIDYEDDVISKEVLQVEKRRLRYFLEVSGDKKWRENPLELLRFIVKYKFQNSVPNIAIVIRIYLTIAVSVASCERSFSKLKLIRKKLPAIIDE